MTNNEFKEFGKYLTGAAEVLDGQLSAAKIQFYFEALKDLSIEEVKAGMNRCARASKFFPKPSEIRESVHGKPEDQAVVAIDKIQNALRGVGGHSTVCFDDPIIHLIIQNYGGWVKLTGITQEEWKWLKKDFIKHYQVYCGRGMALTEIPESLPGMHEMVSASKGLSWPEENTVYVGDEQKALAWVSQRKALALAKPNPIKKLGQWVGLRMDPERKNDD